MAANGGVDAIEAGRGKIADAIYGRRSVKYFDPHASVKEADFRALIHSAMLAPTSFNIQHWRFVRITDRQLRRQLRKLSYEQPKVTDASELLVITGDTKAWQKQPARYWRHADGARAKQAVALLDDFYRGSERLQRDEVIRSCALAAQNIMLRAHELGYGCCPMIGFDAEAVADLINLPGDHLVVMLLAIGKASRDPLPRSGQLSMDEVLLDNSFNSEEVC